MKTLAVFDSKDYDPSLPRNVRDSVRAVIFKGGRLAMVYSGKYEFYSFPGGGVEDGETHAETLIREVSEEIGLIVKPQSVRELGLVSCIRKDIFEEAIYDLRNYYYFCEVEDTMTELHLTSHETDAVYRLAFVSFEEAIERNELDLHIARQYTEPETYVIKYLKSVLPQAPETYNA